MLGELAEIREATVCTTLAMIAMSGNFVTFGVGIFYPRIYGKFTTGVFFVREQSIR